MPNMPALRSLGNFLSGMETLPRTGDVQGGRDLGNFLSGMETDWDDAKAGAVRSLGNFLSGMETPQRLAGRRSL